MNSISPTTFGIIQRTFLSDIIRRVCAVTERSNDGKNLGLRLLAEEWSQLHSRAIPADVERKIVTAETVSAGIRRHRNKRLAHLDARTLRGHGAQLPRILNEHLDAAVSSIFSAMSAVVYLVDGSHVAYDLAQLNNAEGEFEWLLCDSLRFRSLRSMASDSNIPDDVFRRLTRRRSGRSDPQIRGTVLEEEEADG